jgi:Fur family ferric uptake transcriptional regulator
MVSRKREPRRRRPKPTDLTGVIRGAGLSRTGPRIAVLRELEAATAPLSHAEIVAALGADYDRATVYRNLMDLVGAQLVTRSDLGDHVWRFEIVRVGETAHAAGHPHFLCIDCGEVSCLPGKAVSVVSVRGVPRSLRRRDIELQVKGLCDSCER